MPVLGSRAAYFGEWLGSWMSATTNVHSPFLVAFAASLFSTFGAVHLEEELFRFYHPSGALCEYRTTICDDLRGSHAHIRNVYLSREVHLTGPFFISSFLFLDITKMPQHHGAGGTDF